MLDQISGYRGLVKLTQKLSCFTSLGFYIKKMTEREEGEGIEPSCEGS